MQLVTISSIDDFTIGLNDIDLTEDFDVILPFMSKNYLTDKMYDELIDEMIQFSEDNQFIFETEKDSHDRSFVYHFMKEE